MNDAEILKLLATMGIDDMSYQALPLLPLLDVAWADNEIQEGERALVEAEIAKRRLGIEAERVVRNWLTYRPTPDYICLLYTSPSPRDKRQSRMPSSA